MGTRRALNGQKRRFPARAVTQLGFWLHMIFVTIIEVHRSDFVQVRTARSDCDSYEVQ